MGGDDRGKPRPFASTWCLTVAAFAAPAEKWEGFWAGNRRDCRKPGGGYSYFDFMQNRHFDIAGPNPTPEEQKHIDEQYTAYLDKQRRSTIAAAFAAKQQQVQLQQASLRTEKVPVPVEAPNKAQAAASDVRARTRAATCAKHSFSCDWPRLSEGIKDLKKALFGGSQAKAKRGSS